MTHHRLTSLTFVTAFASLGLVRPQRPTTNGHTIVGPNVQVSASMPDRMHTEGMIAADPTNPRRLIVCSLVMAPDTWESVAVYWSSDAGLSWERGFETSPDTAGDPSCAFGPDGAAFLMFLPAPPGITMATQRMPLWRSNDGGRTWQAAGSTGGLDRESLVVDASASRFHGRLYAHGTVDIRGSGGIRRTTIALYTSLDGGRTFGRPAQWAALGRGYIFAASRGVVLSDGRWLTVFPEFKTVWDSALGQDLTGPFFSPAPEPENAWLKAIASDDGGDSLTEPAFVSGYHVPNQYARMTSVVPDIAADATDGPFKDRVYVVWNDSRFGGTDVLLSYSADRGRTWSKPIVVNDDERHTDPAPNHLLPAVAVNGAGIVAVTWLDRRDVPDNLGWRQRIRISRDGGETFLPSAVVSTSAARFDGHEQWPLLGGTTGGGTPAYDGGLLHTVVNPPRFLYVPADYASVTAGSDGVFHPYWIDNRTGWPQVWTAAVHATGKAVRNGSDALSSLDDLTAVTTLEHVTNRYDRQNHTASVTVRIKNTGDKALDGPFTLRLIALDSDIGDVAVVGAANGVTAPGATWIFPTARLEAGAVSGAQTLTFGLSEVKPFAQGHTDRFDLRVVTFDTRLLGRVARGSDDR